mmetsp:Transcript_494/g.979  ORF Transcript_494/g.979 Transcript_494/m.979 type:complete len:96 (+) Transcript_494:142-429(+)
MVAAHIFLPEWNHKELHQIRFHIIQLMEISKKITGLFHRTTGGSYPEVLTIFDKNWNMKKNIQVDTGTFQEKETVEIIQDINYVNVILSEFINGY